MNATPDLDDRINDMLDQIVRSAPTAPDFHDLRPGPPSQRSRLIPVAAAAALVAVGVGGVMVVRGDERDPIDRPAATQPAPQATDSVGVPLPAAEPDEATTPDAEVADLIADGQVGQLLTTEIDRRDLPLLELPGWETTYASSEASLPSSGGFEDALILVGPGQTYDAPLFAGSIVDEGGERGFTVDELLDDGEPVEFGDATGSLEIYEGTDSVDLAGSISLLFVPLEDGGVARLNGVRIEREQFLDLAGRYVEAVNDGSNVVASPEGWTEWLTPDYPEHSTFSTRFRSPEGAEIEVVGENRGAASLLGRIAGDVVTTRTVGETEVGSEPQEQPDEFRVNWRLGDWSFYAMAENFESEQAFDEALLAIQVVNELTPGAGGELVTPANRAEVVDALLVDVPIPPDFDAQVLREQLGSRDRYQEIARVSSAVTCGWLDIWFDAQDAGDPAAGQPAVDALATASDWAMLVEIDDQGGWSGAVWETAAAITGGPGVVADGTGPPTREAASDGLGCVFD
ncbi:MAG: hypothetical protein WA964_12440 [Ilumatobacter sp.]|uniref:hypothetical protein n=1 Tax=Ilumatobacter sp. TaxID=1967498 RepID=UPI003C70E90D